MARDRGNDAHKRLSQMTHERLDQMTQASGLGSPWLAEMAERIAEQNLSVLDGVMRTVRDHSMALIEQSMANATELANRLAQSKDPFQWALAQSDYMTSQAQAVAIGAQSLGQALMDSSNKVASTGMNQVREASRRWPQAA